MSQPNIPDFNPNIDLKRDEVINLILASIGVEELSLAHILNAEGEKLQSVIHSLDSDYGNFIDIDLLLETNKSVQKTLRHVIQKEMLLLFKLENVMELIEEEEEE